MTQESDPMTRIRKSPNERFRQEMIQRRHARANHTVRLFLHDLKGYRILEDGVMNLVFDFGTGPEVFRVPLLPDVD